MIIQNYKKCRDKIIPKCPYAIRVHAHSNAVTNPCELPNVGPEKTHLSDPFCNLATCLRRGLGGGK